VIEERFESANGFGFRSQRQEDCYAIANKTLQKIEILEELGAARWRAVPHDLPTQCFGKV